MDQAAAKEDSDELRDKKRMRSEEAPAPSDPINTGASSSSQVTPDQANARGAKRMSEDDGRADLDEAQIETAKRAAEQGLTNIKKETQHGIF